MGNIEPLVLQGTQFHKKLQMLAIVMIAVGVVGSAIAAVLDLERFLAAYLLGFVYVAGISVTAVFFSTLQFLARAGWSAGIRRIPEMFAGFIPYLVIGFIPIIAGMGHIYHHWMHAPADDYIVAHKSVYLNSTFFTIRIALYAVLWYWMYKFIVGNSFKQDTAEDFGPTKKNLKRAAPFAIIFALTITFFSFDLLMSLEPHWFSTIWGVYSFAGHFVSTIAMITLFTIALREGGYLKHVIREDHYHDLGKLMFAFTVFWTYCAFSQYFLIWYANIPEETIYFTSRLTNGWEIIGIINVVLHFIVPFSLLLRQDVKRKKQLLVFASCVILVSHFIDLAWIIYPAIHGSSFHFSWQEIVPWIMMVGLFLFVVSMQFAKKNVIAYKDPFFKETLEYHS